MMWGMERASTDDMAIGRRLGMTAKSVRAVAERELAASGSNLSAVIISRIAAAEPGLSQRQIADRMHLQGPTVLRHLDRMEADGLLTRSRDDADRRVQRVRLTPKGHAARKRLEAVADATSASLTKIFTADELTAFEGYLDRLAAHAHDLLAKEAS
jgi:MarR family transcriptional regulator for hemolysin